MILLSFCTSCSCYWDNHWLRYSLFYFFLCVQEYDAEKERNSREKDILLNKAEEHRLKGRKLSEELSNLKQNHIKTKQEVSLHETAASHNDSHKRKAF